MAELPDWTKSDPRIDGLNAALNKDRLAVYKISGRTDSPTREGFKLHGQARVVDRGGDPAVYTCWINGDWHITSPVVSWRRLPDVVDKYCKGDTWATVEVTTERSVYTYGYAYNTEDGDV